MLKYPCLVLDHDDTVVQTEKTIGYPYFRDYLEKIRPGTNLSYPEYVACCNNMVFADMCKQNWQFTDAELLEEYTGWKAYSLKNIPPLCPGMDKVIRLQKELGGMVFVASLSTREIIQRDFLHHLGFLPDGIYDNDLPRDRRKPSPYALKDIMDKHGFTPKDMLVVDDMKLGWQMAQQVGADTAFAGWSKTAFPQLTAEMENICNYSFDSAEKLADFLFK